ncbi:uncharacterized protein [Antedon mediterranea]|uniref:uncharacterized protein n=1 Tax=Antedon mediterranea TaxID=105859 RepID=UPI003AF933D7
MKQRKHMEMENTTRECGVKVYHGHIEEKIALNIHIIIFTIIFTMLAVASIISLIRLKYKKDITPFLATLLVTITIFCVSRCLFIAIDPYGIHQRLPILFYRLMADLAFPFITSCYTFLIQALVESYKPRHINKRLFSYAWIVFVISAHIIFVVVFSVLVVFTHACIMLVVCHFLTVVWCMIVIGLFMYILRKIIVTDMDTRAVVCASHPQANKKPKKNKYTCWLFVSTSKITPRRVKLVYVARASVLFHVLIAIFTSLSMLLILHPIVDLPDNKMSRFTLWFFFESVTRFVEACMVLTMLYLAAYKKGSKNRDVRGQSVCSIQSTKSYI